VDLHEHAIEKKVEIMLEHFADRVAGRIGGKAKAEAVIEARPGREDLPEGPARQKPFAWEPPRAEKLCLSGK